jgi:hypothetical protein
VASPARAEKTHARPGGCPAPGGRSFPDPQRDSPAGVIRPATGVAPVPRRTRPPVGAKASPTGACRRVRERSPRPARHGRPQQALPLSGTSCRPACGGGCRSRPDHSQPPLVGVRSTSTSVPYSRRMRPRSAPTRRLGRPPPGTPDPERGALPAARGYPDSIRRRCVFRRRSAGPDPPGPMRCSAPVGRRGRRFGLPSPPPGSHRSTGRPGGPHSSTPLAASVRAPMQKVGQLDRPTQPRVARTRTPCPFSASTRAADGGQWRA